MAGQRFGIRVRRVGRKMQSVTGPQRADWITDNGCNGVSTKEVLNANLKLKGARRAAWFRGTCHSVLRKMGIDSIEGVSTTTLIIGQYGDSGIELSDEEWAKINDNRAVPAPLIHVPDRSVPADRRYGK